MKSWTISPNKGHSLSRREGEPASGGGDSLLRVSLNGEAQVLRKAGTWIERPVASPDGHYLPRGEVSLNSNAWMIENFR